MSDIAIKVENLSKRYRIGLKEELPETFVGAATNFLRTPFQNLRHLRRLTRFTGNGDDPEDVIWALKDVSFEVERGEVVGIIGRNGAGKSTLLKILSRITHPTSGRVELNGRVSSLLEVGTGFHSELTGRENIYLNGTILGMTKAEVDRKFDEIVAFSGVEKFIDTPVKRYSSGMRVRLAFSVAAHLEPEILLIDEVLAVGDVEFQKKCLGKMDEVAGEGRTVLFISHNMGSIRNLCNRALLLENGRKTRAGGVDDVIFRYLDGVQTSDAEFHFPVDESKDMQVRAVRVLDHNGRTSNNLKRIKPISIEINYDVNRTVYGAYVVFDLRTNSGIRVCQSLDIDIQDPFDGKREPGHYLSVVEIPGGLLNYGSYNVNIALARKPNTIYDRFTSLSFVLEDSETYASRRPKHAGIVLALPLNWESTKQK